MKLPLVDLSRQNLLIKEEVRARWDELVTHGAFILGPEVLQFEDAFAAFIGTSHCLGVGNGTDALEIILRALGIKHGNEVILPANTFMATALAVLRAGAAVRLVDCDPSTYLIDIDQAVAAVNPRTRAVIPVHLFGQTVATELLTFELASDLPLVEDAAQSHGAARNGVRAGNLGVAAGTSFYPSKNLGAYGDAGAVLTNRDDLAIQIKALRNWGSDRKYHHPVAGFNSRLDALQAVVLTAKLKYLERWNEERKLAASVYDELLASREDIGTPHVLRGNEHVFHLYVIEIDHRDDVMAAMHSEGVEVGVHYPVPLHLQGALSDLGHRPGDFPNAERAATRMLSLPLFPGITVNEQETVADLLIECVKSNRAS